MRGTYCKCDVTLYNGRGSFPISWKCKALAELSRFLGIPKMSPTAMVESVSLWLPA